MCNIAGYVGSQAAAPILMDMMRRQQGFAGGFYTGIATLHQGKIYYEKLTGDLDHLLENTRAASLPGNIGILHSRSYCGGTGGDAWAHPFVTQRDDKVTLAYVANGAAGRFAECAEHGARAAQLIKDGYPLSAQRIDTDRYVTLPDGSKVHMSDMMCQCIARNIERGSTAEQAVADAFCENPSEIVALLLSLQSPDAIVWARINRPMMLSFASHGAYLATTAMAFPNDAGQVQSLPPLSSGYVYKDHYSANAFAHPPTTVAPLDADVTKRAYQLVKDYISDERHTFWEIEELCLRLFDGNDVPLNALVAYEALRKLQNEGGLDITTKYLEGAAKGLKAPCFMIGEKR